MGLTTEKKERNDEIRALWAKGLITQVELGKKYNLQQSRINAIIYRRIPAWRYCTQCGFRFPKGVIRGRCDDCKAQFQAKVAARRAAREVQKEEKADRQRYLRFVKATEETGVARHNLQKRLLRTLKKKLKTKRAEERKNRPKRLFVWQTSGREHVRFLVRLRDKNTCKDCGKVRTPEEVAAFNKKFPRQMKSFDVHHIGGICGKKSRGYDKLADMDKLITLCHSCHFRRHDFSQRLEGIWPATPKVASAV